MSSRVGSKDDCFAQFDAAFAALSAEIEPTPPAEHQPVHALTDESVPAAQSLDEYEDAFNKLDGYLARATLHSGNNVARSEGAAFIPQAHPASALRLRITPAAVAAPIALRGSGSLPGLFERSVWRARPNETTSLERLLGTLDNLALIQEALSTNRSVTDEDLGPDTFTQVFADARQVCSEFNLDTGRVRADFASCALESGHVDRLGSEIAELIRHMRHDVASCTVSPIANDRLWAFTLTLDEKAVAAFPSAQTELAEGGRCFGLGRYTACVFHMVRAAEYGLCALAHATDARRAVESPDADWLDVIAQLEVRIASLERWRGEPDKLAALQFFQDALRDVRVMHDVARKLAISKSSFDETQALTICQTTRDFIARLSTRVSESQKRTLSKVDFGATTETVAAPANMRAVPRERKTTVGVERAVRQVAADAQRN